MRVRLTYSILLLAILVGCEKEYPWDFKPDNVSRLVVDGIITNESIPQCIKLSQTNQDMNQGINPVSGAVVSVSDGTNSYSFIESVSEAGSYYSPAFQAVINRTYRLIIILGTDTFTANAETAVVTALEDFATGYSKEEKRYHFVYTGQGQPSMTEVYYNWSAVPDYCEEYGNCYAREIYYTLNNIDVNTIFGGERQMIYFPSGTTIIRKKYGLTESHQSFLRSMLMETDWSGGIFDVQHGNVETNLSSGALGFFAACMVVSDTTVVE